MSQQSRGWRRCDGQGSQDTEEFLEFFNVFGSSVVEDSSKVEGFLVVSEDSSVVSDSSSANKSCGDLIYGV